MKISIQSAAQRLLDRDNIVILAHHKPDGDTLGSCFALLFALESLGKTARVECADGYPDRYRILYGDYTPKAFEPDYVVACDVAGETLLGAMAQQYPKVDLCVDHHKSNTLYAEATVLDPDAAATAEIIYRLVPALGAEITAPIASALYTGITTDTGCFRFANTTSDTLRIAADMMDRGADHRAINKEMFDNKSQGRIEVEKLMMDSLDFYHSGRCAIMTLPADVLERFGVAEGDLDGISAFPRRIKGVLCGITIRLKADGGHRVSLRCDPPLDASAICQKFGGGGHSGAAGCTLTGSPEDIKDRLQAAVGEALAALQN